MDIPREEMTSIIKSMMDEMVDIPNSADRTSNIKFLNNISKVLNGKNRTEEAIQNALQDAKDGKQVVLSIDSADVTRLEAALSEGQKLTSRAILEVAHSRVYQSVGEGASADLKSRSEQVLSAIKALPDVAISPVVMAQQAFSSAGIASEVVTEAGDQGRNLKETPIVIMHFAAGEAKNPLIDFGADLPKYQKSAARKFVDLQLPDEVGKHIQSLGRIKDVPNLLKKIDDEAVRQVLASMPDVARRLGVLESEEPKEDGLFARHVMSRIAILDIDAQTEFLKRVTETRSLGLIGGKGVDDVFDQPAKSPDTEGRGLGL